MNTIPQEILDAITAKGWEATAIINEPTVQIERTIIQQVDGRTVKGVQVLRPTLPELCEILGIEAPSVEEEPGLVDAEIPLILDEEPTLS